MKKEKIILSFVATLFGLLVAGIAFYLFQATKTVPDTNTDGRTIAISSPTPINPPSVSLIIDRPKDEEVVDNKVLIVSGKTQSNSVITIITESSDHVLTPSANGDFSTTVTLDNGQNIIDIISIAPNGESIAMKKTITYSQEEF